MRKVVIILIASFLFVDPSSAQSNQPDFEEELANLEALQKTDPTQAVAMVSAMFQKHRSLSGFRPEAKDISAAIETATHDLTI